MELDELELSVKVLYSEEATKFEIRKGSRVLFEKEVDLCNEDGTCQSERGENFISCEDCPSGSDDDYCDAVFDYKCDLDCKEQGREEKDTDCTCGDGVCNLKEDKFYCPADCGNPINPLLKWYIGIGVVLALIIFGIVKLAKRRR